ncbi:aspartyl-tRNA synthetase [Streptomyces sp. 1114.5]|uniref:aspartate--tRNA(Asn) ligase n=1 Tax=unclassified Streptomyces TaxID=2593676 RepID=UPI000BD0CA7E|nr:MULTISPECIES: aspartate--tRNA(Asn) ligase [unclassified Streptomyces]RKT16672.1 aspartyl-tRNA synthetase [Streptomyces sp. 1114.5]SOB82843.1 aspartyl-tRNA synthetase [Streptomyces sp. 1331.2]
MTRTLVADLHARVGETVTVYGWVDTLRRQRRLQFVLVRDHTGIVQVTHVRGGEQDPIEAAFERVTVESAVKITGEVVASPQVKLGGLEIVPSRVEIVSLAEPKLPIDEKTGIDQRLDWRFLDIRRPSQHLVFDVQTTVERAMRELAAEERFTELHTPKLMGTASESGAEVFEVGYFGRTAYLAQSPQFYKQMAIAGGIDRVFEIGPVFRAEPSFTSRHATEFTGVDVEIAWIDGVEDVMAFEERMLHRVLTAVAEQHGEAIAEHFGTRVVVPELPFPRITMADALARLRATGWDREGVKDDLDPEGERTLCALIAAETGHEFVFVTRFPAAVRPFYHLRPEDDPTVTESFDLLWKGVEITTGAQREHRHDRLVAQAREKGMDTGPLSGYLDCFRYGTPPHGGLGLGLGRLLMLALGLPSIREATFLFRGPHRLEP